MERLAIKDGVPGPAWAIVPISENLADRFLFNDVARIVFGRDCATTDEIIVVAHLAGRMKGQLADEDVIDLGNRSGVWEFHVELLNRMCAQCVMDPTCPEPEDWPRVN